MDAMNDANNVSRKLHRSHQPYACLKRYQKASSLELKPSFQLYIKYACSSVLIMCPHVRAVRVERAMIQRPSVAEEYAKEYLCVPTYLHYRRKIIVHMQINHGGLLDRLDFWLISAADSNRESSEIPPKS
jgi:hypothetical protein